MDTNALKKFAQNARNLLIDQVTARLDMVLAESAAARREHPGRQLPGWKRPPKATVPM